MRALIIDDSKAIRTALRTHLTALGFETCEAEDGLEALERMNTHWPIDVATVDWEMPRMTGVEFVAAVRERSEYDGMKLIMVTTLNSLQQVARALRAGADEYLMKPVSKEMLEDKFALMGVLEPSEEVPL
jgi:two-component system chemotaxis response regulator CheY